MNSKDHILGAGNDEAPVVASHRVVRSFRQRLAQLFADTQIEPWPVIDLFLAFASSILAVSAVGLDDSKHLEPVWQVSITGVLVIAYSQILGLNELNTVKHPLRLAFKALYAAVLTPVTLLAVAVTVFFATLPPLAIVLQAFALFLALFVSRKLFWFNLQANTKLVTLIGPDSFCKAAHRFLRQKQRPIRLAELRTTPSLRKLELKSPLPARTLVFSKDCPHSTIESLTQMLDRGCQIFSFSAFLEHRYKCVPVDYIDHEWFLYNSLSAQNPFFQSAKRYADVVISLAGLALSAPIILLAGLAIYLTEGRSGSIFYSQIRTGQHNRPFRIYKLRTMKSNAEASGPKWAAQNDSRITPIGRFLRKTRIDELPQFWNVLRGDMSFVGPRPERPEFIEELTENIPFYEMRHLVKPGITGWAQINYPYGASVSDTREKLQFDLYYIKYASIALDLQISLRTIGAVMRGSR